MSARALVVVDVQNDFCEGGTLEVKGGADIAAAISEWMRDHRQDYALIVASRDWHKDGSHNHSHFAHGGELPDFKNTWPVHCVANTDGADFHSNLDVSLIDEVIYKGQGVPAYSAFEGSSGGRLMAQVLADHDIDTIDVVGIATDFCVKATVIDAVEAGYSTHLLVDLTVAVGGEPAKGEVARELSEKHEVWVQTRDSMRW